MGVLLKFVLVIAGVGIVMLRVLHPPAAGPIKAILMVVARLMGCMALAQGLP